MRERETHTNKNYYVKNLPSLRGETNFRCQVRHKPIREKETQNIISKIFTIQKERRTQNIVRPPLRKRDTQNLICETSTIQREI